LPGLYFGNFADDGVPHPVKRPNARDFLLSGLFLGLAIAFRVQLVPAVLVAVIWICGWSWRKWAAMSAGIAISLLCFGMVDAFTWGYPFASYWNSITVNVFHHKSNIYGKEALGWYFEQIGTRMGAAALLLAVLGARRSWFLTSIASAILLTHMAFPHKEYRFIFPMIPILCILIGLGLSSSPSWKPSLGFSRGRALAAVAVIVLVSAAWAARNDVWHRNAGGILAFREMSTRNDVCGVGIAQWIFVSGGYFYLHHQAPIYLIGREFPHDYDNFNYLVSPAGYEPSYPASYRVQACWSGYCLYERPGSCAAPPSGYSINRLLLQLNK
jgi:GPI mannosyltransferase 3